MHGRLKVRTTAEQQEAKQKERAKKLAAYRTGIEKVFEKRRNGELDEEILKITSLLLVANPDIYTLWNVRKETLLHLQETRKEELGDFVIAELALTEQCIQVNPKSYNAWFQRGWVLDLTEDIDWHRELQLCDKCLSLDDRNFHCWDYRRIVVKKSGTSLEEEYRFSSNKIEANFSNYSSWHYRSELLPRIFPDPSEKFNLNPEKLREEFSLVQNAVFTDPGDQSAWFYHRWLLFANQGQRESDFAEQMRDSDFRKLCVQELDSCRQLQSLEPDNKWVLRRMCELLRVLDTNANYPEIMKYVSELKRIDPLRLGFYNDWGSQITAEKETKTSLGESAVAEESK